MRLTPRSISRLKERLWLNVASFRERVHKEGIIPWRHNKQVRGATALWVSSIALLVLVSFLQIQALRPFYTKVVGVPGGTYTEGIIGSITTINPILADSGANADAARLVFSGLTRYNRQGEIEAELAKSWQRSSDGRTYTFVLQPNIKWHDGQPLTSADVAFTIGLIQDPNTRSPMAGAWQGVEVATPDTNTVTLTLPVRYDPFINSTTVGILPQHVLKDTPAEQLRVSEFNQSPIGSGPFIVSDFDTENGSVAMLANTMYHRGAHKLEGLVLKVYENQAALQSAFRKHQVMGMARVAGSSNMRYGDTVIAHDLQITEEAALFMRNGSSNLSDVNVRQAISLTIDRNSIVKEGLNGHARAISTPVLPGQINDYRATVPEPDVTAAKAALAKASKNITLKLITAQTDDYQEVAARISRQLKTIGIKVEVQAVDVATLQRSYLTSRNYDLLLYGINTGTNLDLYPYWHSSQAKAPGLNVSEYSSPEADKYLTSARTTTDEKVREVRLKSFVDVWLKDVPAVMLYTPNYLYVTQDDVQGIAKGELSSAADRFYNVHNWTIYNKRVPQ